MFEMKSCHCPTCGAEIREELTDGQEYRCTSCQKRFVVLRDKHTEKVGLVLLEESKLEEPLYLPRGSLRAITTILLAVCCWILIFLNQDVPSYLLSLLLTVIGYYFGFRKKEAMVRGRMYDAAAKIEDPLFLPSGYIRVFLIFGFLIAAGVLWFRGRLGDLSFLEFFLILAGFTGGYIFARLLVNFEDVPGVYNSLLHLKGLFLLGSVFALAVMLLTRHYQQNAYPALGCACIISFYFGSRS